MFEFKLPDLGEGIHEGELLQWYVSEGDTIKEDDPLCEVETDKAAVTIPSPRTGTIKILKGSPGDTIHVGDIFVVIDDGSGEEAAEPSEGKPDARTGKDPKPADDSEKKKEPSGSGAVNEGEDKKESKKAIAAPATRRLAREMGINIGQVQGSGPGGRVTPEDLRAFDGGGGDRVAEKEEKSAADRSETGGQREGGTAEVQGIPFLEVPWEPVDESGPVEREPLRSLRRKVAVKTTTSSILIPHVAHMDDIDVSEIESLRQEYNASNPDQGKLTLLAFVVRAVASGLKDYPMFNASVDLSTSELVYKKYYNIGFAADTPRGLMVPVVHDADRQSLAGIGYRIRHLAEKARKGEIEVSDLTGGTFTVTNVGAVGGTHVFPIINAPETAILGLGRVEKRPVVVSDGGRDEIRIRSILPVTLCFDHRAADGAQAAAFVRDVKAMLESRLAFMTRV